MNVLFVCLGNICRSPLAEGIFRQKVVEKGWIDAFQIASAGLGAWHVGEAPDARMTATARKNGCDISKQRAQQLVESHLDGYDLILTMDESIQRQIEHRFATHPQLHKVQPFRRFDPEFNDDLEVPDPYYGGQKGFDLVWDIIERTCENLLSALQPERKR